MAIEIEKKYRLAVGQKEQLRRMLLQVRAVCAGTELEENTLYRHDRIDINKSVLRVRRVDGRTILTFKQRFATSSDIKTQREEETEVADASALDAILNALGCEPAVVYEKRRETWQLGNVEVVIDDLPFGQFMEIEGSEEEIRAAEQQLRCEGFEVEHRTYPQLAVEYGKPKGSLIEARFESNKLK